MPYALHFLSHMPPMKLCPMTTMHPLPSYAYFIHNHLDIPSTTTILRPHLFEPPRTWHIQHPEQLRHLVTSRTLTPMIPDDTITTCIFISHSGHSSIMTKSQLQTTNYKVHPNICQTQHSGHPSLWCLTIWIINCDVLSRFHTNSESWIFR